jgi:hypothetical protein
VPDATRDSIAESLRVMKTLEIKYNLHSGAVNPDAWKKKLEETFTNKYHRSLAIIESLTTNEPTNTRLIVQQNLPWKNAALKMGVSLVLLNF